MPTSSDYMQGSAMIYTVEKRLPFLSDPFELADRLQPFRQAPVQSKTFLPILFRNILQFRSLYATIYIMTVF